VIRHQLDQIGIFYIIITSISPEDIKNTILDPTFEFNDLNYLGIVIKNHLSWSKLYDMISNGIEYPLLKIDE